MAKPSWADAPRWAKWLAQDSDGEWFWYSERPHFIDGKAGWVLSVGGYCKWACKAPGYGCWSLTLEHRP